MTSPLNFLTPVALRDADALRADANGQTSLDAIRKVHAEGPLVGDPVGLAKGAQASRAKDANADDAYNIAKDEDDMDVDEDEDEDETERADLRAKADRKLRSNAHAAAKAIKKIHASGARAEDPDAIVKAASTRMQYVDNRASVKAIKKAQANPMSMQKLFSQGHANHEIDVHAVQRIIEKGRREMRKSAGISSAAWRQMSWPQRCEALGITRKADSTVRFSSAPVFPANSDNGEWGGAIAPTGASNNFRDEATQRPATELVGGYTDSALGPDDPRVQAAVNAVNRDAAVDAIKIDWAKRRRELRQKFRDRPAARSGSGDMGNPA
jgi:hypothetical protein